MLDKLKENKAVGWATLLPTRFIFRLPEKIMVVIKEEYEKIAYLFYHCFISFQFFRLCYDGGAKHT
ncbi:MAG: hypothetical protein J5680_06650 [Neisseriaceae bacterium]|nr:hypothetical protein [Neisseriaceae bacterium]